MTTTNANPVKPGATIATVWDSIWGVVRDRGLRAGDQLPSIRELAECLEVKQTAVRDALLKAETMGLVTIKPRAGAFLQASTPAPRPAEGPLPDVLHSALVREEHNVLHLLDARRLVEIELVGRAAERRRLEDLFPVRRTLETMLALPLEATREEHVDIDIRFHVEIARLAGNSALWAVQRSLMELLRPYLNGVPRDLQRRAQADRSHIAIYETLVAGNAKKARAEMSGHLSLAYDGLLRDLQESPVRPGAARPRSQRARPA
ncbi:MAG: FCD domain-containing protein [Isosphaeraceae bacterium]|nr:FCD domain-containing protein [Isosphaeraceae bacterium]